MAGTATTSYDVRPQATDRARAMACRCCRAGCLGAPVQRGDPHVVRRCLRGADARAGRRVGRDRGRSARPGGRPDRLRQDALGLPVVDRPAGHAARSGEEETLPGPLRLPAQGTRGRRRAQPARTARGHPAHCRSARCPGARDPRGGPVGRHQPGGPAEDPDHSARHPDHHPRVPVPDADLAGTRGFAGRGHGHHRRGPCGRRHQARRPPRGVARAARPAPRQAGATHRPLRDGAPGRRGGPVPRWVRSRRGGRSSLQEGVGPQGRRTRRGHDRARRGH